MLVDKGSIFSSLNFRPDSKAHTVVISKRHFDDLRDMTDQEWADILPVLKYKDSIAKIDKVYHPVGYFLEIPIGELAAQNIPIFTWD